MAKVEIKQAPTGQKTILRRDGDKVREKAAAPEVKAKPKLIWNQFTRSRNSRPF